jgi:photosystem II stability/assembly factor-like uncharacterized protein
VGADGAILRSDNGGYDWEVQKSSATTTIRTVLLRWEREA